ncbi:hypothetical protein CLF_110698, partial [Clonorchis sinensis]
PDELFAKLNEAFANLCPTVKSEQLPSPVVNYKHSSFCHAIRKKHKGRDTAKLSKPRQEKSRCRGRVRTTDPAVSEFALQTLSRLAPRRRNFKENLIMVEATACLMSQQHVSYNWYDQSHSRVRDGSSLEQTVSSIFGADRKQSHNAKLNTLIDLGNDRYFPKQPYEYCITYIHVSRYLECRTNWNMRQPAAAHSVAWIHHKRETQLGSSADMRTHARFEANNGDDSLLIGQRQKGRQGKRIPELCLGQILTECRENGSSLAALVFVVVRASRALLGSAMDKKPKPHVVGQDIGPPFGPASWPALMGRKYEPNSCFSIRQIPGAVHSGSQVHAVSWIIGDRRYRPVFHKLDEENNLCATIEALIGSGDRLNEITVYHFEDPGPYGQIRNGCTTLKLTVNNGPPLKLNGSARKRIGKGEQSVLWEDAASDRFVLPDKVAVILFARSSQTYRGYIISVRLSDGFPMSQLPGSANGVTVTDIQLTHSKYQCQAQS